MSKSTPLCEVQDGTVSNALAWGDRLQSSGYTGMGFDWEGHEEGFGQAGGDFHLRFYPPFLAGNSTY